MPTALKKLNAIKDIVLEEKPKICVSVMFLADCGGEVTRRDLRKAVGRCNINISMSSGAKSIQRYG